MHMCTSGCHISLEEARAHMMPSPQEPEGTKGGPNSVT